MKFLKNAKTSQDYIKILNFYFKLELKFNRYEN